MSELEKKRESEADVQREQNKRADAVDTKSDKKPDDDAEAEAAQQVMPWSADVEGIMDRVAVYVRELRMSMSHSEFRSLVVSYRELSPMGRRAIGNRLQHKGWSALYRALHKGNYAEYQQTWQSDAEAFRRAQEAASLKVGG